MKINFIQISNILSFNYYEYIEQAPKIRFNNDLNILIGQNGSGKSTALEVINFVFKKVLFALPAFNEEQYQKKSTLDIDARKQILAVTNDKRYKDIFRLEPNWDTDAKSQKIRIEIELDEIDNRNLKNLESNKDKLNDLVPLYTTTNSCTFTEVAEKIFTIEIILNSIQNNFSTTILPNISDAGFTYLTNYNFYKELIILYNRENVENPIPPLYESFILIGGYRNYHKFNPSINLAKSPPAQQVQQIRYTENTRSINASEEAEPAIFSLVRLYVAEKHYNLIGEKFNENECETEANRLPLLISINNRLKLINLECKIKLIERRTWEYAFEFFDTKRNKILTNINSLSAGQKAIVHLIFEAYGQGNLKGGLVIIDEPEIHLHYQFQNEYLRIIKEINNEQKCQYILVTHSESLITSQTIDKVQRFSLDDNNHTLTKSPTLNTDQKSLIKILDNSKATYAFFSKKIILVEGDTDRYFFKAVLQILKPELTQEITILDIGGKGNYKNWRSFFKDFGLRVYYICDFDNVFTLELSGKTLVEKSKKNDVKNKLEQAKLDNLSIDQVSRLKLAYDNLIMDADFITNPKREPWKSLLDKFKNLVKIPESDVASKIKSINPELDTKINEKYSDQIYILKKGELEDYTKTSHGNISEIIINFCETKLSDWLKTVEAEEINRIIQAISNDREKII